MMRCFSPERASVKTDRDFKTEILKLTPQFPELKILET